MSSTTSTPCSSASSSPASSPNVSCESVPATPTQVYTPVRPASPVTRPMPQYEQLPVQYHARPAKWVLCYMPNREWAISFVIQHESDNHLWVVPFYINTRLVAKHPWSGEPCQTWIVQDQDTVIDPVYGTSSFTSVRMHRKNGTEGRPQAADRSRNQAGRRLHALQDPEPPQEGPHRAAVCRARARVSCF